MNYILPKSISLADILTSIRIIVCIPILATLIYQNLLLTWILIILAGITDVLDGYFARKKGNGTVFGAKLDPLADKLVIFTVFLWLNQQSIIPFWSLWIIVTRELLITESRSTNNIGQPASNSAKLKTLLQFTSIVFLLFPFKLPVLISDIVF